MGPEVLDHIRALLPPVVDPRLVVGVGDDAGVVRLGDGRLLVQTLDFFPPIVDDPGDFGAIAAANALSDVYAMGGTPLTAMNVLVWPEGLDGLDEVLLAGQEVVVEAGAMLIGGHSVKGREPLFGLSVTGLVTEEDLWTLEGARPGDALVLTKPLGTGIVCTGVKRDKASAAAEDAVIASMRKLNRLAATGVNAATDVTGWGLLGHAWELAEASGVRLVFDRLPLLPETRELLDEGCVTGGGKRNEANYGKHLDAGEAWVRDVFADPQTSGGLLLSVEDPDQVEGVVIGRVESGSAGLTWAD